MSTNVTHFVTSFFDSTLYYPYFTNIFELINKLIFSCISRNKMNEENIIEMDESISTDLYSDYYSTDETDSLDITFFDWIHTLQSTSRYFVKVDLEYFMDGFNRLELHKNMGISELEAAKIYQLIADDDDALHDCNNKELLYHAINYYGLIHARYIHSPSGFEDVKIKYLNGDYGTCPRNSCNKQNCLPIGESPYINISTIKKFCPKCKDIYHMKYYVELDGAFFGPYFPSAFLMHFPELIPKKEEKLLPGIYHIETNNQENEKNKTDKNSNVVVMENE